MADNIATIGINLDTSKLKAGVAELGKLGAAGKNAEKDLTRSFTSTEKSVNSFNNAMVKYGRTIDANGNVLNKEGKILETTTGTYKKLTSAVADYEKKLEKATIDAEKFNKVQSTTSKSNEQAAKSMGSFGKKAGQAGIQFEQLIGSINAGQNPLRALGFQLTDIGFVLGFPLAGAIAGISASMASVLFPSLLKSTELVSDFKFEIDELKDSLNDLADLSKSQLAVGLIDTNKRMNELSKAAEKQRKVIADLNKQLDVGAKFKTVTTTFGAPITVTTEINAEERKKLEEQLEREKAQFDKINQEYKKQSDLLTELSNLTNQITESGKDRNKLSKEQRESIDELNASLQSQIDILKGVEGAERSAMIERTKAQLGVEELDKTTLGYIDTLFELKEAQSQAGEMDEFNKWIMEMNEAETGKAEKAQSEFDRLSDSIMGIGSGFSNTGDVIVDTFGNMAQALDRYIGKIDELDKKQAELDKQKEEGLDITKEQQKLDELRFKTEIQGYADGAKAAASFFDEKTAAHKAFTAAEKALTAIEIAMALKQTAVDVAAGAAKFFAQSGWLGFAGVGGMVAVMAGLGFAGGSSGSYSPPTNDFSGTALGTSEASESLSESIDIQSDMLAELVNLNSNFNALATLTGGLSATVARLSGVDVGATGKVATSGAEALAFSGQGTLASIGDIPSLLLGSSSSLLEDYTKFLGSVKKSVQAAGIEVFAQSLEGIVDNLTLDAAQFADVRRKEKAIGVTISDKVKTDYTELSNEAERQIALVFQGIADTFEESARILGVDAESIVDNFIIDGFKLDLKDLEGDEIQEKINEAFSNVADSLAQTMEGAFGEFQQVGEGMFETINRLAIEQARFNEVARLTGNTLNNAFDVDTAQNVIAMAGGIDNLASSANTFASEFLPISQQIQLESDKLNDILAGLGIDSFSATRQGFVDLVRSIDVTTESGAMLYAQLLQLADPLADLIDKEERLNNQRAGLQVELLEALGQEEAALNLQRSIELESIDESLRALQQEVWMRQDARQAVEETTSSLEGLISSIRGITGVGVAGSMALSQALSAARGGDFSLAQGLNFSALTSLDSAMFGSASEMRRQEIINAGMLNQIADLAENQITEAEQQINILSSIDEGIGRLNMNFMPSGNNVIIAENEGLKSELKQLRDTINMYMPAIAKHTRETADNTYNIYNDGIEVEVV